MDEGLAIIIAALMAILGIFYTSRQQRKMVRKQHTFQVIDKLTGWQELDKNVEFAAGLLKAGKVPTLCNDGDADSCEKIDFVLNYYEFLASAILCGDIDEELVYRMERGRLVRAYLAFIPYIEENREDHKTVRLWENLEFITYRWTSQKVDPFDTTLDRFSLRPITAQYQQRRDEIAAHLKRQRAKL